MVAFAYYIRGMDCSEEVVMIRSALEPLVGPSARLDFDVLSAKLTVRLPDDAVVGDREIRKAIGSAGLLAEPWSERRSASPPDDGFWYRRGRVVTCTASGILLLAGFTLHALRHGFLDALISGGGVTHTFPAGSVAMYIAAITAGGWYIAPRALSAARKFRPDMNLLMTIAVAGAVIMGELFEAAAVTFLFALSLLLESWSVGRARTAIRALLDISPETARFRGADGALLEKPAEEVPVGSIVLVRPGEKIPLDGNVTSGSTTVNQAPITGESMPVGKSEGDTVFAGTINGDGAIEFRSTKAARDTTLSRIISMVEEAQSRRAPAEQWTEGFARRYTPAMIALALLVAVFPPVVFDGSWSRWVYEALVILVIACPCALVISTPVSIISALSAAARRGVLVKGGAFIEAPAHLNAIALDKTGTLTCGSPVVQDVIPMDDHTEQLLLTCAAALEVNSTHPLAQAVVTYAESRGIAVKPAEAFSIIQGKGAEGIVNRKKYWIGSHRFMHEKGNEPPDFHAKAEILEQAGKSVVAIGTDDHVCGIIGVADSIRSSSGPVIRALKKLGLKRIIMLTGDNRGTAKTVAEAVGVDEFKSDLLPEDKVEAVKRLVGQYENVGMIGDGVNDAPAMATASLSVAMGAAGSDAAIETADISLMSDDLTKIPWLIAFSRRTLRVIKQNTAFALGLKFLFIVLALLGVATLWMAIAADMGATFIVIFNALRLLSGRA